MFEGGDEKEKSLASRASKRSKKSQPKKPDGKKQINTQRDSRMSKSDLTSKNPIAPATESSSKNLPPI